MALNIKGEIVQSIAMWMTWVPRKFAAPIFMVLASIPLIAAVGAFSYGASVWIQPEDGELEGGAVMVEDPEASGGWSLKFMATPQQHLANCLEVPSFCGYPDETNTGIPEGVVLTNVPQDATSGPCWSYRSDIPAITVQCRDATIENLRFIGGTIIVPYGGVTLRNVHITTAEYYPINCGYSGETNAAGSCLGLVVEDSEIEGTSPNCTASMAFNGYTARRVNAHGCVDGFKADSDVLIEDSYIHGLAYRPESSPGAGDGTHNDGVQSTGGSNVTLRNSTFKLSTSPDVSAVIQIGTEWGASSNWTIVGNLLDGGGWTINGPSDPTFISGFVVSGNRFTRNHGYGIGVMPNTVYVDNYYDEDLSTAP